MSVMLANAPALSVRCTNASKVISGACFTLNGSGGVTSTDADDAKWTAVDGGGDGLLTLTFPAAATTTGNRPHCEIVTSAAATITEVIFTAIDMEAGTATLRTSKAGTATDPASGDKVCVEILGKVAP